MYYFVLTLKNSNLKMFTDKECNSINYEDDKLCIFQHYNEEDDTYDTLALIPYDEIESIIRYVNEVWDD